MSRAAAGDLLRTRIREGSRFTVFDIDPDTAQRWGEALLRLGARRSPGSERRVAKRVDRDAMIDVAFPLHGRSAAARPPARAGRRAASTRCPGWPTCREAGVHRLNVVAGGGTEALLSGRTRLTLRVPRERDCGARGPRRRRPAARRHARCALGAAAGARTAAARHPVRPPRRGRRCRRSRASWTRWKRELEALGVPCRAICGRRAGRSTAASLHGFSLMLDGLSTSGIACACSKPASAPTAASAAACSCRTSRPLPSAPHDTPSRASQQRTGRSTRWAISSTAPNSRPTTRAICSSPITATRSCT